MINLSAFTFEQRTPITAAKAGPRPCTGPAATVREVLALPDHELDYGRAKLAFDRIIDPSIDTDATLAALDHMADDAWRMAGPSATADAKLTALRRLIYESGPWNDHRPFAYDHATYREVRAKLISNYLVNRLGNCMSMPILFLILADKLGLDMALAMASAHVILRYRDENGRTINLEATSGAMPARDIWLRHILPISDLGVASGFYMRTLSRRENVALMAAGVLQHLFSLRQYEAVVALCEVILAHAPRDGMTLANLSCAYLNILHAEFLDKYPAYCVVPMSLRPRHIMLVQRHRAALAAAHALGWEPVE